MFRDGERPAAKLDGLGKSCAGAGAVSATAAAAPISLLGGAGNLRRVSAVRVGDTTRLAVSKIAPSPGGGVGGGGGGLSLVSVPTAVVTPIKRCDQNQLPTLVAATTASASVLAANHLVLPAAPSVGRKRAAVELAGPAEKYLAGAAADEQDKSAAAVGHARVMSPPTLLSPDTEQDLADALSALAGGGGADDAMVVGGDCLPPVEADWSPSAAAADFDEDSDEGLEVREDWNELVSASCDQLLTAADPDDDDDGLSEAGSGLCDYQRLIGGTVGQSGAARDDDETRDDCELESDTMWCGNWAPENDLGSLLIFGP